MSDTPPLRARIVEAGKKASADWERGINGTTPRGDVITLAAAAAALRELAPYTKHHLGCTSIPVTLDGPGASYTACGPCSCGLDALLALSLETGSGQVEENKEDHGAALLRVDPSAAVQTEPLPDREIDDATKLGDFLRRAITGEDKSALAEAVKAWNDENERRHDAEDRVKELEAELAAIGVTHAALARDFERVLIELAELRAVCVITLQENMHLADGKDCTLYELKRAVGWEPR